MGTNRFQQISENEFLYTDDLLLTAPNELDLKESVEVWQESLYEFGMEINREETEIFLVSKEEVEIITESHRINISNDLKNLEAIIDGNRVKSKITVM